MFCMNAKSPLDHSSGLWTGFKDKTKKKIMRLDDVELQIDRNPTLYWILPNVLHLWLSSYKFPEDK